MIDRGETGWRHSPSSCPAEEADRRRKNILGIRTHGATRELAKFLDDVLRHYKYRRRPAASTAIAEHEAYSALVATTKPVLCRLKAPSNWSDKGDTGTRYKCAIAAKCKALDWRAVLVVMRFLACEESSRDHVVRASHSSWRPSAPAGGSSDCRSLLLTLPGSGREGREERGERIEGERERENTERGREKEERKREIEREGERQKERRDRKCKKNQLSESKFLLITFVSHLNVPGDVADRWVFSEIFSFPRPFIPALLHTRLTLPSSALKISMLTAAQISSHSLSFTRRLQGCEKHDRCTLIKKIIQRRYSLTTYNRTSIHNNYYEPGKNNAGHFVRKGNWLRKGEAATPNLGPRATGNVCHAYRSLEPRSLLTCGDSNPFLPVLYSLSQKMEPRYTTLTPHRVILFYYSNAIRVTVAKRLDCSPPIKANRIQSPIGSPPDFYRRCRWSAGFLGDLPFPLPLHSGVDSFAPHFTFIGW
ncbi:hypothetical protein PR048_027347 [Dryococelus australis]|uniref:Uncharacterized protein n=1 Tax=Dryococelus australis TaxID=614101 RepID=A0ABQ9GF82_9NEOP|nr:hypothetical protein PR048_027347 [Dryococelus australis]